MREMAATVYILCSYIWGAACLGVCTYLVFWLDHSGWWYLLAILLASNSTSTNAAKIRGTWRKEMRE